MNWETGRPTPHSLSHPMQPEVPGPVSTHATFPDTEVQRLLAPLEREAPATRLRRLLHQARAARSYIHDLGVYASHDMVKLVHELWLGIEGARHTHWYDTGGNELLEIPPAFVDMEAGFGGPTQTFALATELIRARTAGMHLENQDPANRGVLLRHSVDYASVAEGDAGLLPGDGALIR